MNELHVNKRHTSGVSSELIFSNYRSLSLSRHLGFSEFHNFAFHCVNTPISQLLTYLQVDIFSFGWDMVVIIFWHLVTFQGYPRLKVKVAFGSHHTVS